MYIKVVLIEDSIVIEYKLLKIGNVFVDSQDDIMLTLLLMYKTVIIIIIIGLSNCPAVSPQRRTSHTRANKD